jgi:hypothetical protein
LHWPFAARTYRALSIARRFYPDGVAFLEPTLTNKERQGLWICAAVEAAMHAHLENQLHDHRGTLRSLMHSSEEEVAAISALQTPPCHRSLVGRRLGHRFRLYRSGHLAVPGVCEDVGRIGGGTGGVRDP